MMKGVPGLLIAVGMGIVGAFCNWLYLAQKGAELDRIDFIGIADDVRINPGDKFNATHFTPIPVPQNAVGGLEKAAVRWKDLSTVIGQPATKSYSPGEILLHQDLKTASQVDLLDTLGPNDTAMGVPVDTRTAVPSMLNPGNFVSFIVPRFSGGGPAPADGTENRGGGAMELLGPFEILAMGNRTGRQEIARASGISISQENVMTVRVKTVGGEVEEKWRKLLEVLKLTNYQQLPVMLHGKSDAAKGGKTK